MKGIIAMYKSEIVEYAKKNDIKKEDYIPMCGQRDINASEDAVDEVIVVTKPWRGFDVETVTKYLCKDKRIAPKPNPVQPQVKPENEEKVEEITPVAAPKPAPKVKKAAPKAKK